MAKQSALVIADITRRYPGRFIGPNIDMDLVVKLEPTRRTLSREGGYGHGVGAPGSGETSGP
jgi:hypothetical protein